MADTNADLQAGLKGLLAPIYLFAAQPEQALDHREPLPKLPGFLFPRWLRVDFSSAALEGNPRRGRLTSAR